MPKIQIYQTGNPVPATGAYSTVCDGAQLQLNQGSTFPPCPACQLAASWRPT